jgi:hypothetical protein
VLRSLDGETVAECERVLPFGHDAAAMDDAEQLAAELGYAAAPTSTRYTRAGGREVPDWWREMVWMSEVSS